MSIAPPVSALGLLDDAFEALQQTAPLLPAPTLKRVEKPTWRVKATGKAELDTAPRLSVEEIRRRRRALVDTYLAGPAKHVLVIADDPGSGKTTLMVEVAEQYAAQGKRVLYLAPRHNLFADVMAMAKNPSWWQHWLPRSSEGENPTCRHADAMGKWLARGYDAMTLCTNRAICGWSYIKRDCPYHAQKRQKAPIVFGQHQHMLAMPGIEEFDLIIGDELPLAAILHEWRIPASHVLPSGMDQTDDLTIVVSMLSAEAINGAALSGPGLLDAMGGAERVRDATEALAGGAVCEPPQFYDVKDIDSAPYFHLPTLCALLHREAIEALAGRPYIPRVLVHDGGVDLLCRRSLHPHLATVPVIWLDGTADQEIYQAIFTPRAIEVHALRGHMRGDLIQVVDRVNGKGAVLSNGELTSTGDQLMHLVNILRDRHPDAAVVSYKAIADQLESQGVASLNFASPGSNRLEPHSVLIVAGTPMPNPATIHRTACMLYDQEMAPFVAEWGAIERAYAGHGYSREISTYIGDRRITALLEAFRERKLEQAVHRVRPLLYERTIYLITGLPVPTLSPTRLITVAQLLGVPTAGSTPDARPAMADAYRWHEIQGVVEVMEAEKGYCTVQDLAAAFDLSPTTARKYLQAVAAQLGWDMFEAAAPGRGRKPMAVKRP